MNSKSSENVSVDYKIVCSAIDGDKKAYEELFKKYEESVSFMVLKITNNQADAEALTTEAFRKTFHDFKNTPLFNFNTCLFKTAASIAIDFLREKKQEIV